jgi:hypothetical protein
MPITLHNKKKWTICIFCLKNRFFCVCSTQGDKKHFYQLNFALYGSFQYNFSIIFEQKYVPKFEDFSKICLQSKPPQLPYYTLLLENTLGNLDRNGSTRFQNVWKFPFNLLWTLSIIAIMDTVHHCYYGHCPSLLLWTLSNRKCIKFVLHRNLLKMQRSTFLSRNLNGS